MRFFTKLRRFANLHSEEQEPDKAQGAINRQWSAELIGDECSNQGKER
jgi:hypothetical protein